MWKACGGSKEKQEKVLRNGSRSAKVFRCSSCYMRQYNSYDISAIGPVTPVAIKVTNLPFFKYNYYYNKLETKDIPFTNMRARDVGACCGRAEENPNDRLLHMYTHPAPYIPAPAAPVLTDLPHRT